MATITISAAGVNNIDSVLGRQGNDTINIAGTSTTTFLIDQDTRYGLSNTPWSGGLGTTSDSITLGGSIVLEGRYVRMIPYDTGTGSVPPAGVTITQGSATGILIGVYSALNVSPESVGAAMPASGYIKIKAWNEVPYTATTLSIPSTSGQQLVAANVSNFEGTLAATDMTVTAGTAVLTNSSTVAQTGSKSLRIAPSSTTTCVVKMANGTRFMIGAGAQATISAYIRGTDVKSCNVSIEWFDASNASLSTTSIQTQNCATGAWTQYTSAAVTAPANTRWASINFTVTTPTSGQLYYVDNVTATLSSYSTGAAAAGADRTGWIEVVGVEGVNHILTAAGQTYHSDRSFCKGSWYEIGTTDGNRATTYQIPTNGGTSYHGAVLVDKAAETSISAASWSGGVATFTSTAHGLATGDRVFIGGVLPRLYTSDINNIEKCTVINANSFSIPMESDPGTYTSGGTVSAVEWYPITNSLNTTIRTEAVPGKVCWLDSATGLLRFGNDNITSTGGYCPASGLKVRIPNVMTAAVATGYATPLTNALAATTTTRCRFYAGTTAGPIVLSQMSGTWNTTVIQTGDYAEVSDSCFVGNLLIASQSGTSRVTFCATGGNATSTFTNTFAYSACLGQNYVTDCTFSAGEIGATTKIGMSLSTAENVYASGNKIIGTGDRTNSATWGFSLNIGRNLELEDTTLANIGGIVTSSQFSDVTMLDTHYWGSGAGYVPIGTATSMYSIGNVSNDWLVDNLYVDQPGPFNLMRGAFYSTAGNSNNIVFRNVGTYATPVDAGTATYHGKVFSRSGTTATITHTAHGLRNGEIIYVSACADTSTSPVSSARTAIIVGVKTITYIDANSFSFTCVNAGATAGTISYFAAGLPSAILNQTSSNALFQNIHLRGISVGGITGSVASNGARHENVTLDVRGGSVTLNRANYNQTFTSGAHAGYEYTQPTSAVLGTHFADYWVRDITTPGAATPVTGVSFTRASTLCTVVSPDHGLYDSNRIYIENASNPTGIPNGVYQPGTGVIVIDKDTFSVTCNNLGSTSGTLDYRLAGDGYFLIIPNGTSPSSAPYVTTSGDAKFTGNGTLFAPAVNDEVIWETPNYMIGWDSFAKFPGFIYGSSVTSTNYDLYYQIDTGSGFSAYKNLAYTRAGGSGSAASTTVTMTSTTGVAANDYIYGIGIAGGAKVVSITNSTDIVVDTANTSTVSGVLTFNQSPNESTFPTGGIKLKIKLVTNTANSGAIYCIHVGLVSTETSRAELYSQLTQYTLTLTGLQTGSDISIRTANTVGSNLVNVNANAGTTYAYNYYYVAGTYIDIAVYKAGYKVAEVTDYLLTDADVSYPVVQALDPEYA